MAHLPPQVAPNVREALQALNNDILVFTLNDNRVACGKDRFNAESTACMTETFALMTKKVLEVNERDDTRPFPGLLDPLSLTDENSDKYKAIAPALTTVPDTWRDVSRGAPDRSPDS